MPTLAQAETDLPRELSEVARPVRVVYFSNVSENTKRFVEKLGFDNERIPVLPTEPMIQVDYDYILVVPTYGDMRGNNFVPRQVIKFLNDETNRTHIIGVVGGGNTNFGIDFAIAGAIIAHKCKVPYLGTFELLGTPEDVTETKKRMENCVNSNEA